MKSMKRIFCLVISLILILASIITVPAVSASGAVASDIASDIVSDEMPPYANYLQPDSINVMKIGTLEVVILEENLSTGYQWYCDIEDSSIIEMTSDYHTPNPVDLPGAPGTHFWTFKALKEGETKIEMTYWHYWTTATPAPDSLKKTFYIKVNTSGEVTAYPIQTPTYSPAPTPTVTGTQDQTPSPTPTNSQNPSDFVVQDGTLISYTGTEKNVAIPDNLGITKIYGDSSGEAPSGAFYGSDITAVSIPEGVTEIGDNSFGYSTSLRIVELPQSLIRIGAGAFSHCNLNKVIMQPGIRSIGSNAFTECRNLFSVVIPSTVTSIADDAFSGCSVIIIRCDAGSYAEEYAKNKSINYKTWYTDLDSVKWAQDSITRLSIDGIFNGYDDGTFRPENYITRAEFIKLLSRMYCPFFIDWTGKTRFIDVPFGAWYSEDLEKADFAGLVSGDGDGRFRPDETITREEMFTFCARALSYSANALHRISNFEPVTDNNSDEISAQLSKFVDGDEVSNWARSSVATLIKNGLLTGFPVESGGYAICPQQLITRAEVAVILDRAKGIEDKVPWN